MNYEELIELTAVPAIVDETGNAIAWNVLRAIIKLHSPYTDELYYPDVICKECISDDDLNDFTYPCGTIKTILKAFDDSQTD